MRARSMRSLNEASQSGGTGTQLPMACDAALLRGSKQLPMKPTPTKPIPSALVYPNLEVVLLNFFAGGVCEASAACISCYIVGIVTDGNLIALAICSTVAVVAYMTHEFWRLVRFYRRYANELWVPSPKVESRSMMDDPLLYGLSSLHLVHPSLRLRGTLEPPDGHQREPYRTLRFLTHPISCGWRSTVAGDQHAKLTGWLADAAGKSGVFYQFVRTCAALLTAFVTGLSANGATDATAVVALLVLFQAVIAAYCMCAGAAGDRIEGQVSGIEAAVCGISLGLLFAQKQIWAVNGAHSNATSTVAAAATGSNLSSAAVQCTGTTAGGLNNTDCGAAMGGSALASSPFQSTAMVMSIGAVALPLLLTAYDSILLPLVEMYQAEERSDRRRGVIALLLRAIFVAPLLALSTALTGAGAGLNAASEVAEDVADSAIESVERAVDEAEEKAQQMVSAFSPRE